MTFGRMLKSVPVRVLAPLILTAALAACATAPGASLRGPQTGSLDAPDDDASVYGLYLAGEAALDDGHTGLASGYLSEASRRAPDAAGLRQRAFAAALLSGQIDQAASLAPTPADVDAGTYALGQLTRAVDEMSHGQNQAAYNRLSTASMGAHWAAAELLRPWAAAAAGNWAAAVKPMAAGQERAIEAFGQLNNAMLLERAGKFDLAEAAFAGQAGRSGVFTLAYGAFLERRGRKLEAQALYDRALAKDPTDPAFVAAHARVAAGRPAPPAPSLRSGAAQALVDPAALLLAQKQSDAGLAYLRLALALDPDFSEAWVLMGDAMEAQHDGAGARAAYARVAPGSPEYTTAQGRLALDLQEDGQKEAALQTARTLAHSRADDPHTLLVLADLYRDDDRYSEAIQTLDQLMTQVGPSVSADWRLYFQRGALLERDGKWADAQIDLQHSLALKPDDPEVLNYLGFAWADRGERLDQALHLLQRANTLSPDSGAFVDSLGWAHYRLGQYHQAVDELEHAASLDPADPDINSHLGDAYWRSGRKLEAEYQWRRVLTLQPDAPTRTAIQAKLASGLPPAVSGPVEAGSRTP